jgi:hypothetical protein
MIWRLAHKYDREGLRLANRHYSRQRPDSPQFMPPGRTLVLVSQCGRAVWGSLFQDPDFTDHAWPGAWVCSIFRNEGAGLSSELARDAIAATRAAWGAPPAVGMITFVDDGAVASGLPGACFLAAGFRYVRARGRRVRTTKGRLVLRLRAEDFPEPAEPIGWQGRLFGEAA